MKFSPATPMRPLLPPVARARRSISHPAWALAFGCGLVISACVGTVGEGSNGQPSDSPSPSSDPSSPGTSSGATGNASGGNWTMTPPPPPPPVAAPGTCGSPAYSTVLTRAQYLNTVSDLFGIDASTSIAFDDANGRKYRPDLKLSALQAEGLMKTAHNIADAVVTTASLPKLLPCDPSGNESACAAAFIDRFGARATRRPISDDMRADLRGLFDAGRAAGDFTKGIKWVVEGLLQSPDFLYHLVVPGVSTKPGDVVGLSDFEVADRLAYFLWNSLPDEELSSAAARGQLRTADQLSAQVKRMRGDARSARTRADFYTSLLNLDLVGALTRDEAAYTPELAQALGKSALKGIDQVYDGDGKSETLLASSSVFVDAAMAKLYGAGGASPSGSDFASATFDKSERHGLLTHPALMAIIAEHDTSDPIHRGTFVYTRMLCQVIPSPPDGVPALPELADNLTTRQRLEQHRKAPQCAACHQLFDPIGLAFENYDSLGRYRAEEHGTKVDSSGEVRQMDLDIAGGFATGAELMDRLAKSQSVRSCMAQQWYEYASRRESDATDKCGLDTIKARFMASGDLNDLIASIAVSDNFRNRLVTQE